MNCPSCSSSDTYRCETAHSQGSSSGKLSGTSTAISSGWNVAFASHGGSVRQTSHFATQAAPPPIPREFRGNAFVGVSGCVGILTGAFLGGILALVLIFNGGGDSVPLVFLLCVGISGLFGAAVTYRPPPTESAKEDYQKKYQEWLKTWICARCGHKWIPSENP